MKWRSLLKDPRSRLDIFAGLVDGILNSLTLAAGRLVNRGVIDPALVVKVATATGVTTLFVFFIAHYAELRAELVRAERQLNLTERGRLATSQLGRAALVAAIRGAGLATLCGIVGAVTPLVIFLVLPGSRELGFPFVFALLAMLGALLAKSFDGSPLLWASIIALAGAGLTWVGMKLNLVS
jgi:hypothetical protein